MSGKVFVWLLAIVLLATVCAQAQHIGKIYKMGVLRSVSQSTSAEAIGQALEQRLRELGWIEGQNVSFERRYAEGKFELLPQLASELVRLPVDIIFAGDFNAALAAKHATKTIPIVFHTLGDPVKAGLVGSLARPGENLTGVAGFGPELSGKRLELLKEVIAGLKRAAFLTDPLNVASAPTRRETEIAAQSLGVQLQIVNVTKPDELAEAFSAMQKSRTQALMVNHDPTLTHQHQRRRILSLVEKARLPAIYVETIWLADGGLMSYGPNLASQYIRGAAYADKVLRGNKPADLPVEQPTKFELLIDLKAAKQIGLTIPPNVLVRADKVIR